LKHIPLYGSKLPSVSTAQIIHEILWAIYAKTKELNYWVHFSEEVRLVNTSDGVTILWLSSLQLLWSKQFQQDESTCKFGIAEAAYGRPILVQITKWNKSAHSAYKTIEYSSLDIEQQRILLVGFIVDLLRLHSISTSQMKFWQGIVTLLTTDYKEQKKNNDETSSSA
jgi:hypothetical protein